MKTCVKSIVLITFLIVVFGQIANAQKHMSELVEENMQLAASQYKILAKTIPADSMPRHYDPQQNKWVNSDTKWWCSGFYPGSLLFIYEYTKDEAIRK